MNVAFALVFTVSSLSDLQMKKGKLLLAFYNFIYHELYYESVRQPLNQLNIISVCFVLLLLFLFFSPAEWRLLNKI